MKKNLSLFIILIGLGYWILNLYACDTNPYKQGKIMYEYYCANCHIEDGSGLLGEIPPLAQSDWLVNHQDQLACVIRYGITEPIVVNGKTYKQPMAGIPQLKSSEITNIINYINHAWGNDLGDVSFTKVEDDLEKCPK